MKRELQEHGRDVEKEEMLKRKREHLAEGEEEERVEEVFKTSKKTPRLLGREDIQKGEMGEIWSRWREEMEEVLREVRGVKELKENFRLMKEEVREEIREQGK